MAFLKDGATALKGDLNNFKDNLVFNFEDTGKNLLIYNDFQEFFEIKDFRGKIAKLSSNRAKYKE